MNPFTYVRPSSIAEAVRLLAEYPDARFLSGGMSLLPMMKQGLAAPSHLIDVTRLHEMQGIAMDGERLAIGAATTHHAVATSPLVREMLPSLAATAGMIADPQVRNRGTLGGALAHSDPAADYPAATLALNAEIETTRRRISADGFFQGLLTTALEPDELLLRVRFRRPLLARYQKFRHPSSGYAMAGVFVARHADQVRVGVTGAAASAFRWTEAEAVLARRFSAAAVHGLQPDLETMIEDLHAGAAYRANLVRVMLQRALQSMTEASHG